MWQERARDMAARVTPESRSPWFEAMASVPRHELIPRWLAPAVGTGALDAQGWVMTYQHDDEARREARDRPITRGELVHLLQLCERKAQQPESVRGHRVRFSPGAWGADAACLPGTVRASSEISRGDVFDVATQVLACNQAAADLLTASFIWGMGLTGYGSRRYRDIRSAARWRIELALRGVRAAISEDPRHPDPVAGYTQFYGGSDYEHRAAPGDERWSRLRGYVSPMLTGRIWQLSATVEF